MAHPSPWQDLTPEQLAHPGHDPQTCPVCAPFSSPAGQRGQAAAAADAARAEGDR